MVRINLIHPLDLTDQHLLAEYNEILMLIGYVKKFPKLEEIPNSYRLGEGHVKFFKDKLKFLTKRFNLLRRELKRRDYNVKKRIDLSDFDRTYMNDYEPCKADYWLIIDRIVEKLIEKPNWYEYEGQEIGDVSLFVDQHYSKYLKN